MRTSRTHGLENCGAIRGSAAESDNARPPRQLIQRSGRCPCVFTDGSFHPNRNGIELIRAISAPDAMPRAESPLSRQITMAMRAVYDAKADFDRAARNNESPDEYIQPLTKARIAECEAVKAMEDHRKQHNC
jgi:hypothetical protein